MRFMTALIGSAIAIAFTVVPSNMSAQGIVPIPGTARSEKIGYTIDRGMPYSGIWITKHVTTFPDGQIMKDQNTRKVWRDSDGRTREDSTWTRRSGVVATVCRIEDPVDKVRYIWRIEPGRQTVVTETHFTFDKYIVTEIWSDPQTRPVEAPGATIVILGRGKQPTPGLHQEKLGPAYINGVYAEGIRSVIPFLLDPTRHHVDEIWTAPDLNTAVKMYLDDGYGSTEDSELTDIDRSEPDPSVFLPPAGLTVRQAPESDAAWKEAYGSD